MSLLLLFLCFGAAQLFFFKFLHANWISSLFVCLSNQFVLTQLHRVRSLLFPHAAALHFTPWWQDKLCDSLTHFNI